MLTNDDVDVRAYVVATLRWLGLDMSYWRPCAAKMLSATWMMAAPIC
jgi:hypothetical protein